MHDVVKEFDIDIVQVIYNPLTKKLSAKPDVEHAIHTKTARITRTFQLDSTVPSINEASHFCRTLGRMRKYASRGYQFANVPKLIPGDAPLKGMQPPPQTLDAARCRHFVRLRFNFMINVLRTILPEAALNDGIIGLGGSPVLARYMCDHRHTSTRPEIGTVTIYVGGNYGANDSTFQQLLRSMEDCLVQSFGCKITIEHHDPKVSKNTNRNNSCLITLDIGPPLSKLQLQVVQCPSLLRVKDQLRITHIKALNLWYDFSSDIICVPKEDQASLQQGLTGFYDVHWASSVPTEKEIKQFHSLLLTMRRMALQGFSFNGVPVIKFTH